MPRSGRRSVSREVSPAVELLAALGEGQEDTLVGEESFELVDSDVRPDYDSTSEDSAFTYERIDGEDNEEGDEAAAGGGHRFEATWAKALMGYPLIQLEGGWVVAPSAQLTELSLSGEIADVLSRQLKWRRAQYAQQVLVKEYRKVDMEGMIGAPRDEGREIDEGRCREAIRQLTTEIEEVESLGRYVEQALRMHSDRVRHECLEVQAVRRARRRERRRRYAEEDRREGRGVRARRWRRVRRASPEL
ncbi:hypothetical protein BGX34_010268 [Mortierella sp. NVP85]|nr:hypothetical protein BGX34_010268 [Mortierella sp. NVP85]